MNVDPCNTDPMQLTTLPARVWISAVVVIVAVIAATVVLIITDHPDTAIALPVVVSTLVPILLGQQHVASTAATNTNKLAELLNGGTEQAVRKVVNEQLTKLVAIDQKQGSTTVADAATQMLGMPTPHADPPATATATGP